MEPRAMTAAPRARARSAPADRAAAQAQALSLRLFVSCLGSAELMTAYLGINLGLYDALSGAGAITPARLAELAGIAPRYAREWLEQQAAAGIVEVDDVRKAAEERAYTLPDGHADALTNPDSPYYVAPLAVFPVGGIAGVLPQLIDAYRAGTGVGYAEYGAALRGGQGGLNRSVFVNELAGWIRTALPDVHRTLRSGGRVADIACGSGWSSIAIARAYPEIEVHGYDLDATSVEDATANAKDAGVADRVRFEVRDVAEGVGTDGYDLVCLLDALHDMARPVEVLTACRLLAGDRGSVLLMEPRVGERFTAPAKDVERFMYSVSLLHCLPSGLAEQPSAATGAMIRPPIVRDYARRAGFADARALPVEHTFHRLYRLVC
jgi:2-polyprenyl-3-methyl-5-hydroxy-6-metoxy-1,4-benzoquinol methylase